MSCLLMVFCLLYTFVRVQEPVTFKPDAAKQPCFKPTPRTSYAHPYYCAPFILIGNWR
jgi:CHAT domain-containing protein